MKRDGVGVPELRAGRGLMGAELATFIREFQQAYRTSDKETLMALLDSAADLSRRMWQREQSRPRIVVLCGSTKFYQEFQRANYEETMAGHVVLSVGFYMHSSQAAHGETFGCTPEQEEALDALHLKKIEMADEVLVLNVLQHWCPNCKEFCEVVGVTHAPRSRCCGREPEERGYVGKSTRNEILYAQLIRKPIRSLHPLYPLDLALA